MSGDAKPHTPPGTIVKPELSMEARRIEIEVIDDETARIMRSLTGAQKLKMASDMLEGARRMLMHHLRTVHPTWSEGDIAREAARRLSHGSI